MESTTESIVTVHIDTVCETGVTNVSHWFRVINIPAYFFTHEPAGLAPGDRVRITITKEQPDAD